MKSLSGEASGYHDWLRAQGLLSSTEFDLAYEEVNRILSDGPYMEERLATVVEGVLAGMLVDIHWASFYPSPIKCGLTPAGGSAVFSLDWNPSISGAYVPGTNYPTVWNTKSRYNVGGDLYGHTASVFVFRRPPIGTDMNHNHMVSPLSMLRVGDTFDVTGASTAGLVGEETNAGAYTVTEIMALDDTIDGTRYVCGLRFEPNIATTSDVNEDTALQISVRTGEIPRPSVTWVNSGSGGMSAGYVEGHV